MEFKDGFIGMLVKHEDKFAYICGIAINSTGAPVFKIRIAGYDIDSHTTYESEPILVHPSHVSKLK